MWKLDCGCFTVDFCGFPLDWGGFLASGFAFMSSLSVPSPVGWLWCLPLFWVRSISNWKAPTNMPAGTVYEYFGTGPSLKVFKMCLLQARLRDWIEFVNEPKDRDTT